ncbi:hypothetical protein HDU98_006829 [Podochytrium sp. JEL0797]|nr:hypothetical protein HDU98_006829 [Podochytrium sp. JEL0797]
MHIVYLLFLAVGYALAAPGLTHTNVLRSIDLTGNGIVRQKISVKATNTGTSPATEYEVAVAVDQMKHLSAASVKLRGSDAVAAVSTGRVSGAFAIFSAPLSAPLAPGASAVVDIALVFTESVRPLPAVIGQNDQQFLLFQFSAYFDSPYDSKKQKTVVRMPSGETIVNPTGPEPFAKKGSVVSYGPYEDIAALDSAPVSLHYKDNKPILVAKSLQRDLELSHWGSNLDITEYYDLYHRGAALRDKLFSRVDFQFAQNTRASRSNVLEGFRVTLPPKAAHVYFRDDIGNVSTTNYRKSMIRDSILDVRPRYPLYGGWKYNWHQTYDLPLNDYLKKDTTTGRYLLQVKFMGSLSNVTIEDARLRVVLPEGALNVKVDLPFQADSITHGKFYTNFDSIGRPMITIQKNNAADEYAVNVQISYEYPTFELYRKPLVISTTLFGLLLFGIFYTRLDFSLVRAGSEPSSKDIASLLSTHRQNATKTIALAQTAYVSLDAVFEKRRSGTCDEAAYNTVKAEQGEKLERCYVRLAKGKEAIAKAAAGAGKKAAGVDEAKDFVKGMEELEKGLKQRFVKAVAYQGAVLGFLKEIAETQVVDEKKKNVIQEKVVVFEKEKRDGNAALTAICERVEV